MIRAIESLEGELGIVHEFETKKEYEAFSNGFSCGAAEYGGSAALYTLEELDDTYWSEEDKEEARKLLMESTNGTESEA